MNRSCRNPGGATMCPTDAESRAPDWTRRRWNGAALSMAAALLPARVQGGALRQPVQLIVPFAAGGLADSVARLLAEAWDRKHGQPVVVLNRPGAVGTIATAALVRSRPDEPTLMVMSQSSFVSPLMASTSAAVREMFAAVRYSGLVALQDSFLVVAGNSGLRSFADFEARHGRGQRAAAYASLGLGSLGHVLGLTLAQELGIDAVHIPYNGSPPILQSLLAGDVLYAFTAYENFRSQLATGAVTPLVVAADRPSPVLPGVPGAASVGLKAVNRGSWFALAHAAHADSAFVAKASAELMSLLSDPQVVSSIRTMGLQPSPLVGDALQQHLASERIYWAQRVSGLGL